MRNNLFFITLTLLFVHNTYSQEKIQLKGLLVTDSLDASSVHIINTTTRTGTVNSSTGRFNIEVRENDTLLISSIQFINEEIIISHDIFNSGQLRIQLIEDVNELPEVKLSNIGLTGNINTDVASLDIVKDMPVNMRFGDIKHTRFEADINDPQAAPDNLAFKENQVMSHAGATSVDLLAAASLIGDLLGIKKKHDSQPVGKINLPLSRQIREMLGDSFFIKSLGIKEENIGDFVFYLDDTGLTGEMLKKENQFALIEFLFDHSAKYKALRGFE
ncbi:hypothetical protein FHG64_13710 [Antarcticibacterium flavum]|uniref:Carboxypeptidase-like regulatory domain-containing protein n=1 Tax=Antarcticibacterium flavum TaxID=2058175 RepID=A0A5B7X4R4_9FLAO|nr:MULTISPECIES: hypothetical protein [Antarcticibacterium]MCM4160037.1 hypothetical protein [Antarcticibacterium sp. W02-3]QCY70377.1 hypothetical protein FHG64_13710 [Antarcticibacterium flavum]